MTSFFDFLLQDTITMMAIVDPLGVSAIMLSLLGDNATKEDVSKIALKSTMTIIIAFFVVLISGNFLLKLFGIEIDSLKVMGGIVLLLMAIKMVNGLGESKNQTKAERAEAEAHEEFSIIPLAIPITFGPGIFATVVILRNQSEGISSLIAFVISFLIVAIISRLMGLIVGAIAIQFIVSGLSVLIKEYI